MMKTVSVVIPSYNEEAYIENCVRSILASNYPQDKLQVLVCDGQSTDATQEIVKKIAEENPQVVLLQNLNKTTPFALNLGLKYSSADVKIILGAHSTVDDNFVLQNVKVLETMPEVGCAGGVIENVYENNTSESIGLAMSSTFGVGNAHFRTGAKSGFVDTVAFGAYRKEVFENIGYFDESLTRNQDDEFNYRVTKAGYKIYLEPNIRCKYYVRGSFTKLYKQYFQYGYWKVFVNKKHGAFLSIRQLVPPAFVLYLLLLV